MNRDLLVILLGAFLGIALGKALDYVPVPQWAVWGVLAAGLLVGLAFLQGAV